MSTAQDPTPPDVAVDVTPTMDLVERLKTHPDFEGVRVSPLLLVAHALLETKDAHAEAAVARGLAWLKPLQVLDVKGDWAGEKPDVRPGGYIMFDSSWPLDPDLLREDVHFLGVPLAEMCNSHFAAGVNGEISPYE